MHPTYRATGPARQHEVGLRGRHREAQLLQLRDQHGPRGADALDVPLHRREIGEGRFGAELCQPIDVVRILDRTQPVDQFGMGERQADAKGGARKPRDAGEPPQQYDDHCEQRQVDEFPGRHVLMQTDRIVQREEREQRGQHKCAAPSEPAGEQRRRRSSGDRGSADAFEQTRSGAGVERTVVPIERPDVQRVSDTKEDDARRSPDQCCGARLAVTVLVQKLV